MRAPAAKRTGGTAGAGPPCHAAHLIGARHDASADTPPPSFDRNLPTPVAAVQRQVSALP